MLQVTRNFAILLRKRIFENLDILNKYNVSRVAEILLYFINLLREELYSCTIRLPISLTYYKKNFIRIQFSNLSKFGWQLLAVTIHSCATGVWAPNRTIKWGVISVIIHNWYNNSGGSSSEVFVVSSSIR